MENEIRYIDGKEVVKYDKKDWFTYMFKKEIKNIVKKISKIVYWGFEADVVEYELYQLFNAKYVKVDQNDTILNPLENVPMFKMLLEEYDIARIINDIVEVEKKKKQLDEDLYKRLSILK